MAFFFESEAERQVFEKIAPNLEAQGYEFLSPDQVKVPAGDWGYIPDFVAQRGNEYIAIEVKTRRTRGVEKSLEKLKSLIEENENWRFLIY